jgi:hypothetical protein
MLLRRAPSRPPRHLLEFQALLWRVLRQPLQRRWRVVEQRHPKPLALHHRQQEAS